jgi:hypothetical protein
MSNLLYPGPMQFNNAPPPQPAPMIPQQQLAQQGFAQRFKQNLGPILQAAGIGLASGNWGGAAAAMPGLAERRQQQMQEQQAMAQEQQRLNATAEWAKTQDPEVAMMLEKGMINGSQAVQMIQQKRQAAQGGDDFINAGDGRLFNKRTQEWVMAPGSGKPAEAASPLGKLKRDLDAGLITPEQYKSLADRQTAAPTQGGLTTAQKNDLGNAEAAIQTLNTELDAYAEMVGKTGNAYLPGQTRDAVAAKRRNIQLQMKELYNLGVLNGPDLALMDQMLYDAAPSDVGSMVSGAATSLGGALGIKGMDPASRAKANAETLKSQFKELLSNKRKALGVGSDVPDAAPRAADEVPPGVDPADWEFMTPEERALWN